ncbi:hypothetical protein HDR66_01035, partial [bacterium]|nr:hypothetical protein [bacterium]
FFFFVLLDGIGKKKYNTDVAWRKNALGIVDYIMQYGPDSTATPGIYGPDYWPRSAVLSSPTVFEDLKVRGLPENKDDWFQATYDDDRFKSVYPRVLDELLRSELVRTEFAKHERTGKVVGQLDAAIKDTDYENPDSKDYVPPKPNDEKNIFQTIKKWKEDTYENYLRRFTEPGRGTRLYFSPFAHTIIKAIDKEKIKPTDGIAGILDKKDKIMGRISAASPTAKKHFEWITKTLGKIKGQIPNAFGDALKGGAQLQDVVSQIIIAAVKENKVEEAKTAMEILAVCKYGITTSKTMDAIANTDLTILSDKDLSWNKNEGMRVVTKAMDKTIKYSIVAAGRTLAAARNAVRHANTKFNGDISKNNDLNKAYKAWVADDKARYDSEKAINDSHNVTGELATLAAGGGLSGHRIDATTLDTAKADLKAIGEGNPGYDELKEDIDKYIAFSERRDLVEDWRGKNKDRYQELVAYWDLMASTLKTHSFQLGMISVREQFMKNRAQNVIDKNLANYGGLQYAA